MLVATGGTAVLVFAAVGTDVLVARAVAEGVDVGMKVGVEVGVEVRVDDGIDVGVVPEMPLL